MDVIVSFFKKYLKSWTVDNKNTDALIGVIIYAGLELAVIFVLARTFTREVFGEWLIFYSLFFLVALPPRRQPGDLLGAWRLAGRPATSRGTQIEGN
jgi:hypothetical protein